MSNKIHRRDDVNIDDVNIEEGVKECGDVEFADTTNHKYPIDTPEHVRAAWSYINQHDNSATYETSEVKVIY